MRNNIIAILAFFLILVSFFSIFLGGNESVKLITGFSSAQTELNLSEETSILITGSINFGTGRVYANASQAILRSDLGYYYQWGDITNYETYEDPNSMPEAKLAPVAYDEDRDVFVMYGVSDSGIYSNRYKETWEYNYSAKSWKNLSAGDPLTYEAPGLVYDSGLKAILAFGGINATSELQNRTWKLNSTQEWVEILTTGNPPSGRLYFFSYDSKRNLSVVIKSGQVYEFNSSSSHWSNRSIGFGAISRGAMTFDSNRNVSVIFGGNWGEGYTNETWEYDGTTIVNRTALILGNAPPRGVYTYSLTYDTERKKILLAGGEDIYGGTYVFSKEWEYNGTHWKNVSNMLEGRYPCAVYYPYQNKTLTFYGFDSYFNSVKTVWEYNSTDFHPDASINGTWYFQRGFFNVENDGTVNISVNFSANKNAQQFIGGTSPGFKINGIVTEQNSCTGLNTTFSDVPNSTEAPKTICPLLEFQNNADSFNVATQLFIPGNAPSGKRNSTIIFSASKV